MKDSGIRLPVEGLTFHKSSYSDRSNCVEVADLPTGAAVPDTQNRNLGHLEFGASEWTALLDSVRR